MKRFHSGLMLAVALLSAGLLLTAWEGDQDQPVNKTCPVSQEAIDGKSFTTHKGQSVGLCCPSCAKQFQAWSDERKDAFMASAGQAGASRPATQPKAAPAQPVSGEPYALDTCIVSGKKLGSMGDPVLKVVKGRQVRFCCAGCIPKFEGDVSGYLSKIDERMMADQRRYYPTDTCVVSGEPLVEDGEDIAHEFMWGNRLLRACCKKCERQFRAEPGTYLAKLNEATVKAQRKGYPLDTCVVAGGKLGSMGEPSEIVVAGRLIRFCCASCEPKVLAYPMPAIGKIDAAWASKGRFQPHEGGAKEHEDHDEHKGHDHDH